MDESNHKKIIRVLETATFEEKNVFKEWASELITLSQSSTPKTLKAKQAIAITLKKKVIWHLLKNIGRNVKTHGWDQRTLKSRMALITIGGTAAVFGGQSAGIAALGGAIGIPLWVIFGGGAAVLGMVIEDMKKSENDPKPSDYIDIQPIDISGLNPYGIRTRVAAVKGRCPRPLDERDVLIGKILDLETEGFIRCNS